MGDGAHPRASARARISDLSISESAMPQRLSRVLTVLRHASRSSSGVMGPMLLPTAHRSLARTCSSVQVFSVMLSSKEKRPGSPGAGACLATSSGQVPGWWPAASLYVVHAKGLEAQAPAEARDLIPQLQALVLGQQLVAIPLLELR